MLEVCDTKTKSGDRVGERLVNTISPRAADKLYDRFLASENGERPRTAEKMVILCRKAWRVVHWLYPDAFRKVISNPSVGATMKTRVKRKKAAVTREQVYAFAHGCIEHGEVEAAGSSRHLFRMASAPGERGCGAY
jgi:hypothetical protein